MKTVQESAKEGKQLMLLPEKQTIAVPCMPGDVFFGVQPRVSPRRIRKYTVETLLVCKDNEIKINCSSEMLCDGEVVQDNLLQSFSAREFVSIMFPTFAEAKAANPDLAGEESL